MHKAVIYSFSFIFFCSCLNFNPQQVEETKKNENTPAPSDSSDFLPPLQEIKIVTSKGKYFLSGEITSLWGAIEVNQGENKTAFIPKGNRLNEEDSKTIQAILKQGYWDECDKDFEITLIPKDLESDGYHCVSLVKEFRDKMEKALQEAFLKLPYTFEPLFFKAYLKFEQKPVYNDKQCVPSVYFVNKTGLDLKTELILDGAETELQCGFKNYICLKSDLSVGKHGLQISLEGYPTILQEVEVLQETYTEKQFLKCSNQYTYKINLNGSELVISEGE